jgi:predicted DsbA family dithiol-disulfide isomerase
MSIRLDVWTDYTCPFCFLATNRLESLQEQESLEIHWRAFMLRPPGSPPQSAGTRAMVEQEHAHVKEKIQAEFGFELHPGPIGISTYAAHLATKYAAAQGKGDAFHAAVMNAYWREGQSIDDQELLKQIATQVGLQSEDLAVALEETTWATAVQADIALADKNGINGVPALVFGEKYLVSGAQPEQVLKRVITLLQEEAQEREEPEG